METNAANQTDRENNKGTILVVDDDEQIRALMAYVLRRAGYNAFEAAGPIDAQNLVDSGGNFDLLLTDFQMPEMNGVELATWFHAVRPGIPVLIVTGTRFKMEEYLEREALYPCLAKPFKTVELVAKVAEVLTTRVIAAPATTPSDKAK